MMIVQYADILLCIYFSGHLSVENMVEFDGEPAVTISRKRVKKSIPGMLVFKQRKFKFSPTQPPFTSPRVSITHTDVPHSYAANHFFNLIFNEAGVRAE